MSEGSAEAAYRRGDVILVPMDFTDRSGSKVRPAVVVSGEEYNEGPDVLIASVTSNREPLPHPGDHRIRKWKAAGLLKPSLAQTKLATVEAPMIWQPSTTGSGRRWGSDRALTDLKSLRIYSEAEATTICGSPPERCGGYISGSTESAGVLLFTQSAQIA